MKNTFRGSRNTAEKLDRLAQYLQAFTVALKDQGFGRIYIDAFAGSGSLTVVKPALPLFSDGVTEPEEVDTPGSARLAAMLSPPFDAMVLIEKDMARFAKLGQLKADFPDLKISLHNGDANAAVAKLCRGVQWHKSVGDLRGFRGVIFLDPFGMEVGWATVQEIAATQALDCFYFFPLSGLYRQAATKAWKLTDDKRRALDRIFGTDEWFDRWYGQPTGQLSLLDEPGDMERQADVNAIERYVKERLETVFRGKVLAPVRLYHNSGAPLASLFFAVSNPKPAAVKLATGIASHILRAGISS